MEGLVRLDAKPTVRHCPRCGQEKLNLFYTWISVVDHCSNCKWGRDDLLEKVYGKKWLETAQAYTRECLDKEGKNK